MARISRTKKTLVVAAAIALTIAGAGGAYAYWTSGGEGDGEATTGNSVDFVVTTAAATGTLTPGSAGQSVGFTVTNPGPDVQYFTAITVTMADDAGVPWVPDGDCDIADYTAVITTPPTAGTVAVAGTKTGFVTVTLANTAVNQDDCQGQTVPLHLIAT
jgi:hypothetical protein